jgi:L,D-transpeptidase catalytic domain
MKFTSALILLLATQLSFAYSAIPIAVEDYVDNESEVVEASEPTLEDVQQDILEMKGLNGSESSQENSRIQGFNPANSIGKLIIRIHKSSNVKIAEYLEVFRQGPKSPADLTAVNLFDGGKSNRALVSTATGRFKCRGGGPCVTPSGNFSIDTLETMHYSSRFNNSPMPHSMFFIASVGIAIHGIPKSEWKDLGKQASHGCVRIHPTNAKILFTLIQKEGGRKSGAVVQIN